MASTRLGALIFAGAFLLACAAPAPALHAQTNSGQTSVLSYDDLAAEAKRASAAKESETAKHDKKNKHAKEEAQLPDAAPASAPAVQVQAPAPEAPAPVTESPAVAPAPARVAEAPAAAPAPVAEPPATAPVADVPATTAPPATAPAAEAAVTAGDANPADAPVVANSIPNSEAGAPAPVGNVPPSKAISHVSLGKMGKLKEKKEKPPKLVPVNIVKGELTVDGLIAKADLNFQILDIKYFYVWVPGLGTTVMSNQFFPGSKLQEDALDGNQITVKVDGHQLQLACDHQLLEGKKPKPIGLYVALDKEYQKSSIYPEFGYGDVNKPPYSWPGSLVDANPNAKAPPLPPNLRQKTESVKLCQKNPDGTDGACHTVEVPLVLSKKS